MKTCIQDPQLDPFFGNVAAMNNTGIQRIKKWLLKDSESTHKLNFQTRFSSLLWFFTCLIFVLEGNRKGSPCKPCTRPQSKRTQYSCLFYLQGNFSSLKHQDTARNTVERCNLSVESNTSYFYVMFHSWFIASWKLYSAIDLRFLKGSGQLAMHGLDTLTGVCFSWAHMCTSAGKEHYEETKLFLTWSVLVLHRSHKIEWKNVLYPYI